MVDREEGDPDTAEHQHAESQENGLLEYAREISNQNVAVYISNTR